MTWTHFWCIKNSIKGINCIFHSFENENLFLKAVSAKINFESACFTKKFETRKMMAWMLKFLNIHEEPWMYESNQADVKWAG